MKIFLIFYRREETKVNDFITEEGFYSSTYDVFAVIDYYDRTEKILVEKKKCIKRLYKGFIFQLYAQYYALKDNGEEVKQIYLYSISDRKFYLVPLPENALDLKEEFELTLSRMRHFKIEEYFQTNKAKCEKCIYSNLCDRSLDD